jgi:thymidylate synthase (FAD)
MRGNYYQVLDNGFVGVVDYMGDDNSICRSARCSYGKGTKKKSDDRGLIRHLMRHRHTSPFEMCEIIMHIGLPIFVARQWVRHRTASLNEYSGRFSVMPCVFYSPAYTRHQKQSQQNKQGSSSQLLGEYQYGSIARNRERLRDHATDLYNYCLSEDLARELSRIDLPLSTYTYWYWKIDLHNLMHFLKLRLDEHAQWEIRQYAGIISSIFREIWPITYEAFYDYILCSTTLSLHELNCILGGADVDNIIEEAKSNSFITEREKKEFKDKLRVSSPDVPPLPPAKNPEDFEVK